MESLFEKPVRSSRWLSAHLIGCANTAEFSRENGFRVSVQESPPMHRLKSITTLCIIRPKLPPRKPDKRLCQWIRANVSKLA